MMNRRMLVGHLAQAEKHAAGGMKRIARQQSIIVRLQNEGLDSRQALALLNAYRNMQALSEANVERLRIEVNRAE